MTDEASPSEPPRLTPSVPPPPPPPPPPSSPSGPTTGSWSPPQYGAPAIATTNGYAIASMVLGIAGFFVCGVGSILALVFGYKAKREIDESGGLQKGRGMAVAGIVLGWAWVALIVVVIILVIALPNDS